MTVTSYRTAIRRNKASAPLSRLEEAELLKGRILDYGCGHGSDVRHMVAQGMDASGYDPHWLPNEPEGAYDTIICTYVLNVVPIDQEQGIIDRIQGLLAPGGQAFFTVRRDLEGNNPTVSVITPRGIQRYVDLMMPVLWEKKDKYCTYLFIPM